MAKHFTRNCRSKTEERNLTGVLMYEKNLLDEAKHPAVLSGSHHITRLMISDLYRRNIHVEYEHLLSHLRLEYWSLNSNQCSHCIFCKIRCYVCQFPLMADLSKGRAALEQPTFSNTGVNLFEPIYIQEGRKRIKMGGVVHLFNR